MPQSDFHVVHNGITFFIFFIHFVPKSQTDSLGAVPTANKENSRESPVRPEVSILEGTGNNELNLQ